MKKYAGGNVSRTPGVRLFIDIHEGRSKSMVGVGMRKARELW